MINYPFYLFYTESFNYFYQSNTHGIGSLFALHSHNDQPIVKYSSQFINVGTLTQILITPEITETTIDAIDKFEPLERQCYIENETELFVFNMTRLGLYYSMDNCLQSDILSQILLRCHCTSNAYFVWQLPECTGEKLDCSIKGTVII